MLFGLGDTSLRWGLPAWANEAVECELPCELLLPFAHPLRRAVRKTFSDKGDLLDVRVRAHQHREEAYQRAEHLLLPAWLDNNVADYKARLAAFEGAHVSVGGQRLEEDEEEEGEDAEEEEGEEAEEEEGEEAKNEEGSEHKEEERKAPVHIEKELSIPVDVDPPPQPPAPRPKPSPRGAGAAVRAPMCPLTPCMTPTPHLPRGRRMVAARPLTFAPEWGHIQSIAVQGGVQ